MRDYIYFRYISFFWHFFDLPHVKSLQYVEISCYKVNVTSNTSYNTAILMDVKYTTLPFFKVHKYLDHDDFTFLNYTLSQTITLHHLEH